LVAVTTNRPARLGRHLQDIDDTDEQARTMVMRPCSVPPRAPRWSPWRRWGSPLGPLDRSGRGSRAIDEEEGFEPDRDEVCDRAECRECRRVASLDGSECLGIHITAAPNSRG